MNEQQKNFKTKDFPFKRVLTLEPLIEFWKEALNSPDQMSYSFAVPLLEKLKSVPELTKPIEDLSIIKKHKELVDSLMTVIYPASSWHKTIAASVIPMDFTIFYSSPLFDERVNFSEDIFNNQLNMGNINWDTIKIMKVFSFILQNHYDIKLKSDVKMAFNFPDKITGLDRYFQFEMDVKFLRIKINGEKPGLSQNDIKTLLNNPTDIELWKRKLPPEKFELHGFTTINATEVTIEEVLSSLKHILLEKESLTSENRFAEIEHKMRSYFNNPDLMLGLAALRRDKEIFVYGNKIGHSFVMCDDACFTCADYSSSIYSKAVEQKGPIITEDIQEIEDRSIIEEHIYKKGVRNLVVAPLFDKDELIGFFEIGSQNPKDITQFDHFKLKELVVLFATAVKRSLEDYNNEIRNLIREEFTAIHPAVEWRFVKAALNFIERKKKEKNAQMESIIFKNVYPLYGVSDIRDSSIHRNDVIQSVM